MRKWLTYFALILTLLVAAITHGSLRAQGFEPVTAGALQVAQVGPIFPGPGLFVAQPPILTFQQCTSKSGATTTFTGVNIGTASADRLVVAIESTYDNQVVSTPSSPLINGSAATTVSTFTTSGAGTASMIMYQATVPTGTTADFAATMAASNGVVLCVYTITRLSSTTAFNVATPFQSNPTATSFSTTVNTASGGVTIAYAAMVNTTFSSWAGIVTSDGSNITFTSKGFAASASNTSAASGANITINWAGAARGGLLAASWR